ncbi:MAG TPA: hypothetical protein VKP13_13855 [Nitrospira sp.]|nr:hypothetical protein [Nitrospira sp.]
MFKPEDVTGVAVSLKVADDLSLFALLAADGSINRMGTGTIDNAEKEMCIGVIDDPKAFQNLRAQISPDLFKWVGGRADPSPRGKICELMIGLFLPNKEERMIFFKYGSKSIEPPPEIKRLVLAMVEVTNPWYEQFKAGIAKKGA